MEKSPENEPAGTRAAARYTTGQFAKLCGVKKQTLFHYDDIGLLEPAYVEENGYRRYSHEQYRDFLLISCLKETGMSLAEVKSYLDEPDAKRREAIVRSAMRALDDKIAHLERARAVLARTFSASSGQDHETGRAAFELDVCDRGETPVLSSPALDSLDDEELVETVAGIVKTAEPFASCLRSSDVVQGICDNPVYLLVEDDGALDEGALAACGLHRASIPAGRYARMEGEHEESSESFYREFLARLADADLVAAGLFVEEYRTDPVEDSPAAMSAFVRVE